MVAFDPLEQMHAETLELVGADAGRHRPAGSQPAATRLVCEQRYLHLWQPLGTGFFLCRNIQAPFQRHGSYDDQLDF